MSSNPLVQNTLGVNPVTNMTSPTAPNPSAPGGSWLGRPPMVTFHAPQVPGLLWQGKGRGRFSLVERVPPKDVRFARGPRIVPQRGTFDVWATAPASGSAASLLLAGEVPLSSPVLDLGVTAASRLTGALVDAEGTTVAEFTDASLAALVEGRRYHIQFSWDAETGTVAAALDGVTIDSGDFSTAPSSVWAPGFIDTVQLNKGTGTGGWDAAIDIVQISSQVLI